MYYGYSGPQSDMEMENMQRDRRDRIDVENLSPTDFDLITTCSTPDCKNFTGIAESVAVCEYCNQCYECTPTHEVCNGEREEGDLIQGSLLPVSPTSSRPTGRKGYT